MKLITERTQIRDVVKRYADCYRSNVEIVKKLQALNVETATTDDVAKIIGNRSWVRPVYCSHCESEVTSVVQVDKVMGQYYMHNIDLCMPCLKYSVSLIENEK